jgi:hypothetical protein
MKIEITETQRRFILKAIDNKEVLYDFENIGFKEFKETYGFSKKDLEKELINLIKEIYTDRGLK